MEQRNLQGFILGIVIIGLTLVFGIFILAQMQINFRESNTAGTAVNESVETPEIADGYTLSASTLIDGSCGTITLILNATTDEVVDSGDYTQTGCLVTNTTSLEDASSDWYISYPYTYSADTSASNASGDITEALANNTGWITIIVVLGFAVIVLGMLSEGLGKAAGFGRTEAGLTY